jgi:Cu2+-exporting ATPase/Cu+-exporting ATPase
VGIAMGCGADLTREHADVCLMGSDLSKLPEVFRLARRTVRTIHVNLFWACAYNAVGVGLALTGRLNPAFAAAAMVVSSLFVVANSLRLGLSQPAGERS